MSDRNGEVLSERERACLAHVQEAGRLGLSFSRYCREKDLKIVNPPASPYFPP